MPLSLEGCSWNLPVFLSSSGGGRGAPCPYLHTGKALEPGVSEVFIFT